MLEITAQEIAAAGGVLAAISGKSRQYARSLILQEDVQLANRIQRLSKMQRIIVHASPHLDEYFGVYLFRACLPDQYAKTPVQEEVLYSHNNDFRAKQIWPTSVLIGFGGTQDGGAKHSVWTFDEHVSAGKQRRSTSCARMVMDKALKNKLQSLRRPLQLLFGEVDHIDSSGQAHDLHLGHAVKVLHETRFQFSAVANSAEPVSGALDDEWKRVIVEAVFTAVAYAMENGINLSEHGALYDAAKRSLDHYGMHSLWNDDPHFNEMFTRHRGNVLNTKVMLEEAVLKYQTNKGQQELKLDTHGHPIPQRMVLPRVALACEACWGPVIGQIIMAHLWETFFVGQLWYRRVTAGLEAGPSQAAARALVGNLELKQLEQCVENVTIQKFNKPDRQEKKAVWVLSLVSSSGVITPNKAMSSYINKNNGGLGLCLIENARYGTRAVFRCKSFPYARWMRLIERLFALEGDADDEQHPGAWHKTPSSDGLVAPFLVNGNRAHQYVPPSSLDLDSLAELVARDYKAFPS